MVLEMGPNAKGRTQRDTAHLWVALLISCFRQRRSLRSLGDTGSLGDTAFVKKWVAPFVISIPNLLVPFWGCYP